MRILDLYDDPSAAVLKSHLGRTGGELGKLASFAPQEPEELAQLPDRLFALVGFSEGEKLRKYAMHDPEHLTTSIVYFLECGGQLPEPVRAKVAQNLIGACGWYETAPPLALTKVAILGQALNAGLALTGAPTKMRSMKAQNADATTALRAAQMSGVKQARAVSTTDQGEASAALDRFIRGEQTTEDMANEWGDNYPNAFLNLHPKKEANLLGTEAGTQGALGQDPRSATPQKRMAMAPKVSSWLAAGDFTFAEEKLTTREASIFALPDRELYPIDTQEQVKRASDYFEEHQRDFTSNDRRMFAQSVALRADELGVKVSGFIEKIGSNVYGPHIRAELQGRINAFEGTPKVAAYEVLLENLDRTPPVVMYDMLKQADEDSGLDNGYGRPVTGFKEPLSAVFGAPEKPIYTWAGKGAYITEEQLRSYAKLVPDHDKVMGDGWTAKFTDNPVKEFEKLPDAKKLVICRLASNEAFRYI